MKLLSTNHKLKKCDAYGWRALGLQLAPHNTSGYQVCPMASTSADYPSNKKDCIRYLKQGGNVSVVFKGELPKTWEGFPVVNGDEHDLTFGHGKGVVIGLALKGYKAFDEGCAKSCIAFAGRGNMPSVKNARQKRTEMLFEEREAFLKDLDVEMARHKKSALKAKLAPCVRLNTFSDLPWEQKTFGAMPDRFPSVMFYDYTKITKRAFNSLKPDWPSNYHLTLSLNHMIDN